MVIAPIVQESCRYALDDEQARHLPADVAPGLPEEVAAALVRLAGGDEAVLVELGETLTPEQVRGAAPPPCTLPVTSPLGRKCRAALAGLPGRTGYALLIAAAAGPDLPPAELLAAAVPDDLAVAEYEGLVAITSDTVQFVPAVL